MTSEWYVGSAGLKALNDRIYGYIYMHFLGHYPTWSVRSPIDDYLGTEYTFYYDPKSDNFEFDGFNTDSI